MFEQEVRNRQASAILEREATAKAATAAAKAATAAAGRSNTTDQMRTNEMLASGMTAALELVGTTVPPDGARMAYEVTKNDVATVYRYLTDGPIDKYSANKIVTDNEHNKVLHVLADQMRPILFGTEATVRTSQVDRNSLMPPDESPPNSKDPADDYRNEMTFEEHKKLLISIRNYLAAKMGDDNVTASSVEDLYLERLQTRGTTPHPGILEQIEAVRKR